MKKFVKFFVLSVAGMFGLMTVLVIVVAVGSHGTQTDASVETAAVAKPAAVQPAAEKKVAGTQKTPAAVKVETAAAAPVAAVPVAEQKGSLPKRGGVYTVTMMFAGPRDLKDKGEVTKYIKYDTEGLVSMMMSGRAAMVNAGETVRVIDLDVSMFDTTWVQVRVVNGKAKGLFWVPREALGFK